jgi:O-antigen/teichoic acid export membrane protein
MTGTIFSQFISIAASFLLARLYNASAFGGYAAFLSLTTITALVAVSSYDKALMLTSSDGKSRSTIIVILYLGSAVTLLASCVALAAWGFQERLAKQLPDLRELFWVPLGIVAVSAYQVFLYLHLRRGGMKTLAGAKIIQSLTTGVAQLALSSVAALPGLIVGHLAGLFANLPPLVKALKALKFRRSDWTLAMTLRTAKQFERFPKYTLPNELIDSASTQIQILLIGSLYSLETLGQYAFSNRILSAPAALVGQAVGQAFFHAIANEGAMLSEKRKMMIQIWSVLAIIGLPVFGTLFMFGEDIFSLLFGTYWSTAGKLAEYGSPLLYARFISSPTSTIYIQLNMQRQQLVFSILALIYRVLSTLVYFVGYDIYAVIIFHSVAEICFIIIYNFVALREVKNRVGRERQ